MTLSTEVQKVLIGTETQYSRIIHQPLKKEEELQWISSSATDPPTVAPKRAKNSFIIFQSYLEKITEKDMIILMEYLNAKVVMDNIEHERIMK